MPPLSKRKKSSVKSGLAGNEALSALRAQEREAQVLREWAAEEAARQAEEDARQAEDAPCLVYYYCTSLLCQENPQRRVGLPPSERGPTIGSAKRALIDLSQVCAHDHAILSDVRHGSHGPLGRIRPEEVQGSSMPA